MKLTKKTLGRAAAAFLATAMLASFTAIPAFAADTEPVVSVPFEKVITTDGDTCAPATTFEFVVAVADAGTETIDGKQVEVLQGVEGVLSVADVESSPIAEAKAQYTLNGTIAVDATPLEDKEPGIYHYTISEKSGNYEGIIYDTTSYDIYVYYMNNEALTDQYVKAVVVALNGTKVGEDSFIFTNNYGAGSNDSTHDVTIEKVVTGSFANMSDTFSFEVSVSGDEGEMYKVVYTNKNAPTTIYVTSGDGPTKIDGIGNGDTIHIYGLSGSDTYTVKELDGVSQGYTVSDEKDTSTDGIVSGNATKDEEVYKVTNTKEGNVPTGIVMDVAPYVLLVVVAAAGCLVFLRKRNNED